MVSRPRVLRSFPAAAAALLAALTLAACGSDDAPGPDADRASGFPMTVENCGRQVRLEQRPERVLVIGGEAGTLVHAAGGTDRISTFSPLADEPLGNATRALAAVPRKPIEGSKDISREVIIGERPDLVVTYGLNEFTPGDLEAVGIPTLIISGYCGGFGAGQSTVEDPLEGVFDDVEMLGRVLGTERVAAPAAAELRARVRAVREQARRSPPAVRSAAALFVAGTDSALGAYGRRIMIHQQLRYVGVSNVFADTDERYFEPTTEALVDARPDLVVGLHQTRDVNDREVRSTITDRPALRSVPAVADGRIVPLDFFLSGHGTLAVDGLEQLSERLARAR